MDLLERYVYDVCRRLPTKQRGDIGKELKSLLMDALEARAGGREPSEGDVAAVLREFGEPEEVASRYIGERFVVGPRLYSAYRTVLVIVLCSLAFGLFMSYLVGYIVNPAVGPALGTRLLQFLGGLISSGWGAVGVVTVIFWGIGRGIARWSRKGAGDEPWDPKSLPQLPKQRNAWRPSESIVVLVFIIVALVVFNAAPGIIALWGPDGAGLLQRYEVLSPVALATYLPLWDIGFALSLALHLWLLIQGRRSLATNLAHIALQLYGVAVVCVMMAGPTLLNLAGNDAMPDALKNVLPILNMQFRWIFIVILAVIALDTGMTLYRVIRKQE